MGLLQERFVEGYVKLPGSVDDFCRFLGVGSPEELEGLDFSRLEKLPAVIDMLMPLGGGRERYSHSVVFSWCTKVAGKFQKRDEKFVGRGKDYNQAALSGLLVYWEMITRRQQQSTKLVA